MSIPLIKPVALINGKRGTKTPVTAEMNVPRTPFFLLSALSSTPPLTEETLRIALYTSETSAPITTCKSPPEKSAFTTPGNFFRAAMSAFFSSLSEKRKRVRQCVTEMMFFSPPENSIIFFANIFLSNFSPPFFAEKIQFFVLYKLYNIFFSWSGCFCWWNFCFLSIHSIFEQ